jgi:23S rRNA (uracil1939-C5)-methyltransferase
MELQIDRIGHEGDGIAFDGDNTIYVPYTLAGETIDAEVSGNRAIATEIKTLSPQRIEPICPKFKICGGCALQHWQEENVLQWKGEQIDGALSRAGINTAPVEVIAAFQSGRRRAKFSAKRNKGELQFGFVGARSHDIIAIDACPILTPNLSNYINKIRELVRTLTQANEELTVQVTDCENGIDVDICGLKHISKYNRGELETLARAAEVAGIARLTLDGDDAYFRAHPFVKMGNAVIELPAGAFLQATETCENLIAQTMIKWAKGAKKAVDLFCGIGTFSVRLKELAQTNAYEIHQPSIIALNRAAKALAGGRTLTGISRDLFRVPVSPLELKNIDLAVLDPARAGAEAQIKQLVRTKIPKIIYISCEATSFARDAKILIDAGYKLKEIKGFDQFRFSTHVEMMGLFVK